MIVCCRVVPFAVVEPAPRPRRSEKSRWTKALMARNRRLRRWRLFFIGASAIRRTQAASLRRRRIRIVAGTPKRLQAARKRQGKRDEHNAISKTRPHFVALHFRACGAPLRRRAAVRMAGKFRGYKGRWDLIVAGRR